ncbi:MAG: protein phosphatase 2C domain-containing protein [Bacteroidaceae bacterium]|nr:protein phosphatase 2C domain-containing protein [Bacteroidaceae bacterium]
MNIKISQPQCYSALGKKPNQEDSLYPLIGRATVDTRIFLVCDGMGGHEHGEVASACVAETIGKVTAEKPLCSAEDMRCEFEQALLQAYCNLDKLDCSESEKKMGTTLTFLAICSDGVFIAHIGDSRVYQLRQGKGVIFQTRDHSLVNDLIASGELTEKEARTFPQRNVITRAIQPHQEYPAKATYNVITDIRKGDVFFLCCDGVVEQLENDDLSNYLLNRTSLKRRLTNLSNECESRGTKDNNTAYLIEIDSVYDVEGEGLTSIVESDTLLQNKQLKSKWIKVLLFVLIIFVIVVAILVYSFFFASFEKQENLQLKHQSEQVQGTISRN